MYQPTSELLKKYADVLVKFALRSGDGAKKGDVIFVQLPECAKPFYLPLQQSILEAGAYPIFEYLPDGVTRHFFNHANDDQIVFYPTHFFDGKVLQMTHVISIIAEVDKNELQGIDPQKIAARIQSRKEYKDKRNKKELDGQMTWTIGMYGTEAMAEEAKMSLEEYWEQIIKACYLNMDDPIAKRQQTTTQIDEIKQKLNNLNIQKVHIQGADVDLEVKIGSDRQWLGGSGRNIPSFEIFTSPDRRGTNGWIKFNQPLYRYGQIIRGISLEFKEGIVTHFDATENKELLAQLISNPNANKLGEFSLTDSRHSQITRFMGETLYDENMGGEFGNTHVAIGSAFNDTYKGDARALTDEDLDRLGFNQSAEHTDIISTVDRKVTAFLEDGNEIVIYENGQFTV